MPTILELIRGGEVWRYDPNRLFGFCNPTSVITSGGPVFIFLRRAYPVAQERAPT